MKAYLDLLNDVLTNGHDRPDRTGVGTRGVFGRQMRIDLSEGFPLLTTKRVHLRSIVYELIWFLQGNTNVKFLQDYGVTIWNEWADKDGELGPVYGKQWRRWEGPNGDIDQIENLIKDLRTNPYSRRHIVSAWNPADVSRMKLPPCHTLWQCYVDTDPLSGVNRLSLHLYARSIDIFLGLPFNIASYALLLELLALVTGMKAGELVISFGDLHLYSNHREQAIEQLSRTPRPLPKLYWLRTLTEISQFNFETFLVQNYDPHPPIKAPIAV